MNAGNIIAIIAIVVGFIALLAEQWLLKKREIDAREALKEREIEAREYRIRRKQYDDLLRRLVKAFHTRIVLEEKRSDDDKLEMDYAMNLLYLYASTEVVETLNKCIDLLNQQGKIEESKEAFQTLISAMRHDLIKGEKQIEKIEIFIEK